MQVKIYMDVCCLNRPFDDQTQDRIRLESEAVATILNQIDRGKWIWIGSQALWIEINRMKDNDRKVKVLKLFAGVSRMVSISKDAEERGRQLMSLGIKAMDAVHVACAECAKADMFLTTDDRLENMYRRYSKKIKVRIANPLDWLAEVNGL